MKLVSFKWRRRAAGRGSVALLSRASAKNTNSVLFNFCTSGTLLNKIFFAHSSSYFTSLPYLRLCAAQTRNSSALEHEQHRATGNSIEFPGLHAEAPCARACIMRLLMIYIRKNYKRKENCLFFFISLHYNCRTREPK